MKCIILFKKSLFLHSLEKTNNSNLVLHFQSHTIHNNTYTYQYVYPCRNTHVEIHKYKSSDIQFHCIVKVVELFRLNVF